MSKVPGLTLSSSLYLFNDPTTSVCVERIKSNFDNSEVHRNKIQSTSLEVDLELMTKKEVVESVTSTFIQISKAGGMLKALTFW